VRLIRTFAVVLTLPLWGAVGPSSTPPSDSATTEIVDRYVSAIEGQQSHPKAVSMEVDMDAQIPGLKKHGRFHALRFITKVGQIFYNRPRFEGDNTVKKEVIARYLEAEAQARAVYANSLAITPANYKFKFKGTADYGDRPVFVFQVAPRKNRIGLFKGELWIDQQTYLPLREWGELVKNPSVFLKKVYFVRDYYIYDGVSIPRRLISEVNTRLVGRAQLTIWFDNYKLGEGGQAPVAALPSEGAAQLVQTENAQH
jgi:hypothetical protein